MFPRLTSPSNPYTIEAYLLRLKTVANHLQDELHWVQAYARPRAKALKRSKLVLNICLNLRQIAYRFRQEVESQSPNKGQLLFYTAKPWHDFNAKLKQCTLIIDELAKELKCEDLAQHELSKLPNLPPIDSWAYVKKHILFRANNYFENAEMCLRG